MMRSIADGFRYVKADVSLCSLMLRSERSGNGGGLQ
jgi:hypothetical protein